jgi:hypothetical protein
MLLPTDTLARLADGGDLPGLRPADYHLIEGETLRAAANRAWTRLTAAWASFRAALDRTPEHDLAIGLTRERWLQVLFFELGYGRLTPTPAGGIEVEGTAYPVSHVWEAVPAHLVGARVDLDKRTPGAAGAARRPPYSMVQELLNRSDEHLWGFVSNGLRLQVLRDSTSLTRQSFIEFDLEAMFDGEVFSDFVVLWLLCHQSRVEPTNGTGAASCWLERWRAEAISTGTRALEQLRGGVEEALRVLGRGFVDHPANAPLRAALASGELSVQDYYRALLRLVYRLLFCFVAEDRDVLLHPDAGHEARHRYERWFSTARLRQLAARRRGTRHSDQWTGLRLVFDALGGDLGCPQLGLPPLGGMLFAPQSLGLVGRSELRNVDLLTAVRHLSQVREGTVTRPVDYRNLGAEELGSVYESLLQLAPQHDPATGEFRLQVLAGNERKTTGSYYTPSSLIDCLLDSTLDPLLDEASNAPDPEAALLDLTVCDPACGSGHFLVAAARRIASRLAAVRAGDAEPPESRVREAMREVVARGIYGVDANELAAELAKVSLWLEAVEPGKPLPFLDAHIKVGNSLLGTTPTLLARGLPDIAFTALTGDDKARARELARRNKAERQQAGQGELFDALVLDVGTTGLTARAQQAARVDDTSIAGLQRRAAAWRALETSPELADARLLADAWCAAFVWPKMIGAPIAVTQRVLTRLQDDPASLPPATRAEVKRLAMQYNFFHWYLEFPDVFRVPDDPADAEHPQLGWSGGFSCVLGNPPWERVKLQEQEFFAAHDPDIATAPNAAARRRLIAALPGRDPRLFEEFQDAKRRAEGESHFLRLSGRYPLCGRGDINTYAVFAETDRMLLGPLGRLGVILPTGIATDATTQHFFRDVATTSSLASLYDFENAQPLFDGVHRSFKFCLLTLTGRRWRESAAEFAFFLHDPAELAKPDVRFALKPDEITLLNPNTGTCPVFRSRRDAEITLAIYRRMPVLIRDDDPEGNPWGISFMRMFDMSNDSGLFHTREQLEGDGWRLEGNVFVRGGGYYLPLYEAKMLHHYDHRWATYEGREVLNAGPSAKADSGFVPLPRYWVADSAVAQRLELHPRVSALLGWRDICRSTDERTLIAAALPKHAVGDKFLLMFVGEGARERTRMSALLQSVLSSFASDYVARQKIGGTSFKYFSMQQVPVPLPSNYSPTLAWSIGRSVGDWITGRVLELTYTAWDMAPYARDLGYDGPPFVWDEERRALLRAELNAAHFHLYGIDREDVDYIMDTFPIVRRKDEARFGEYRTKRLILEIYDRMAAAVAGGPPFDTVLDPPPGSGPTHPPRDRN